jgi:tetratricopeptide (TPR) repeat protein
MSNLGELFRKRGDLVQAEAWLRDADERGSGAGAFNLGIVLASEGDLEGAEAAYRRAQARGSEEAGVNLGTLLVRRGDLDGAIAIFERADGGGFPLGASNLGAALLKRGDYEGAERAFERSFARGVVSDEYRLGLLYERRGDLRAAARAYRHAKKAGVKQAQEALMRLTRTVLDEQLREKNSGAATRRSGAAERASNAPAVSVAPAWIEPHRVLDVTEHCDNVGRLLAEIRRGRLLAWTNDVPRSRGLANARSGRQDVRSTDGWADRGVPGHRVCAPSHGRRRPGVVLALRLRTQHGARRRRPDGCSLTTSVPMHFSRAASLS